MFIFHRLIRRYKNANLSFEEDVLKQSLMRSLVYLLIIVIAHATLMMRFENFSWTDALWLTFTTLSTTGYGDISAATLPGKISTVLLLYFGGIFILAKFAGDYFDYRASNRIKKMKGFWEWNMKNHLLIINTPSHNGEAFFIRFIEQLRNSEFSETTIEILTERFPNGLPGKLSQMPGLAHHTGNALHTNDLISVSPEKAKYIIILSKEEHDPNSDSRTFDILYRLNEMGVCNETLVVAECVDDNNRDRFRKMGADIVMRPIRAYPEMLVRGLVAPGSEQIIENLFSVQDDQYIRYDIDIENMQWKEIVSRLIMNSCGIAVAYIVQKTGLIDTNPPADTIINTQGIFIMVNGDQTKPTLEKIKKALKNEKGSKEIIHQQEVL